MTTCKLHPFIDEYLEKIESGYFETSEDIKMMVPYAREKLSQPNVTIDTEKIDEAVRIIHKYFPYEMFEWEKFILACAHAYYDDDSLVFNTFFLLIARGNGKNGFISPLTFYFSTHYHGVKGYDVEIVANSEDQAKTSFEDIYNVIDENHKLHKFFNHTKARITNLKTKSKIRYYTSNAKTKDSLRSGCLIFDEVHAYEDYSNIKVFTSGLGKKKHARTFLISTQGYVRGSVLDDYIEMSENILKGEIKNKRMLPLLYRMDSEDEIHDRTKWEKANPSLRYLPELKIEIEDEYENRNTQPQLTVEFMTKRMNLPAQESFTAAVDWPKIEATNQPFPLDEFEGLQCLGAVDYAEIRDFCSVGLLFKKSGKRYWHEHTFICHKALKVESRPIKFDVELAKQKGLVTVINKDTIQPEDVAEWFLDMAERFHIVNIAADDYRARPLKEAFELRGLPLKVVRSGPPSHNKIAPLIDVMFANEEIVFGDNMTMRWYTNNVYAELDKKGNKTYYKIEPRTRKTDGFFALLHALLIDDEIQEEQPMEFYKTIAF